MLLSCIIKLFAFIFVRWPDVTGGQFVEDTLAPEWLKKYLAAKRTVEARLTGSRKIRACMYRPSLIWDWTKVR